MANAITNARCTANIVVGEAVASPMSPMLPLLPLLAAIRQDVLMYHVGRNPALIYQSPAFQIGACLLLMLAFIPPSLQADTSEL